jgi:hypothetical protein
MRAGRRNAAAHESVQQHLLVKEHAMGIARLRRKWPLVAAAAAFITAAGTGSAIAAGSSGQSGIPFGQPMLGA